MINNDLGADECSKHEYKDITRIDSVFFHEDKIYQNDIINDLKLQKDEHEDKNYQDYNDGEQNVQKDGHKI